MIQSKKLLFLLLVASILFLFVYNAINYDPIQGYDADAHHEYINNFFSMFMPGKSDLKTNSFTREFFSPPLPYFLPAFVGAICRDVITGSDYIEQCKIVYKSFGQILQYIIYLVSLYFYLLSFKIIYKNRVIDNIEILLLISILTVNYKTFSMLRGEPYIIFFLSLLIYQFLKLTKNNFIYSKKDIVLFGITIGFLALSRQWAFLLFPGFLIVYFYIKNNRSNYLKFMLISFLIGFSISSWFYFDLFFQYGSMTSFNAEPKSFSFSNQPKSFYTSDIDSLYNVFTKPIRPQFSNQLIPILYSDLWGDYWGYFSFTSRSLDTGRNQLFIGDYLARVNLVSLLPTAFFLYVIVSKSKLLKNKKDNYLEIFNLYLLISVLVSFFGYLWFLIKYPELQSGDTIKATYMIQMFHLIAFLSAQKLKELKTKNIYALIMACLIFVFVHNFSAMMSHF